MKRSLLIGTTLALLIFQNVSAQLKGLVKDEKGNAIPYANVGLVKIQDSTVVARGITDTVGSFNITVPEEGPYLLRFTAMGYLPLTTGIQISGQSFQKDFGVIHLQDDPRLLREVTVKSFRPVVLLEADKVVVDVERTALAAGSSAFEMLEKLPGVWVDQEGNIQINGQAGVRILIDGRASYLSGKELQTMLEGMSAENIKSIEIIAKPSAKYEAAGSGGILNLRMKTNTLFGMNGSLYGGFQYNQATGYNTGLSLNHKRGSWNSSLNLDIADRPRLREGVMVREFHSNGSNARFHQLRDEAMTVHSPALRIGTDFEINDRHSVGGIVSLSYNGIRRNFRSDTQLDDYVSKQSEFVKADNQYDGWNTSASLNLHYNGQWDSTGTNLTVNIDYIDLGNQTKARYVNMYTSADNFTQVLRTNNPGFYDIYSANIDLSKEISKKSQLEMGLKASQILSGNELNFYSVNPLGDEFDASRSNNYRYQENIFAGYLNIMTPIGKVLRLQAGLRAEETIGKGESVIGTDVSSKRYLDLFPSLLLTQTVSDQYQIAYNISRRIDRPNYRSLNPFIFYQDPYSWAEGNPSLRPQYTNSFQITQTLRRSYSFMVNYSTTRDFFAEVPQQNTVDNTTVYQERNIDKVQDFSATLIAPLKMANGWESNNNIVAGIQNNHLLLQEQELKNDQWFLTVQTNHTILLPWNIQMQTTAAYSSPSTFGIYRFKSQWWMDAGIKKSVANKKLDITLASTDIFRTREIHGDASYNSNRFNFVNYFMMRSIKLNLRYNFQKGQNFKAKNKKTTLEELNRAGAQ